MKKKMKKPEFVKEAKQRGERMMVIENEKVKPCLAIKLAIEYQPYKDKALAQEVGGIMEEMLQAVEREKEDFSLQDNFTKKIVVNNAVRHRMQMERQHRIREKEAYEQMMKNNEKLKQEIKEYKEANKGKKKRRKKYTSKNLWNGKILTKKNLEELEKYKKEQKEALEEYRKEIKESRNKNKRDAYKKRKKEFERRKKEFEKYTEQKNAKLKEEWDKMPKWKEEQKKRKSYRTLKKRLQKINDENLKQFMEDKKELDRKKKEREDFFLNIRTDFNYKKFDERHEEQFRALFDFYYNYLLRDEMLAQPEPMLNVPLFNKFCADFDLTPVLMNPKEHNAYVKEVISKKGQVSVGFGMGLNFEDFKEFCLLLITKEENSENLNAIFELAYKRILKRDKEDVENIDPFVAPHEDEISKHDLRVMKEKYNKRVEKNEKRKFRNYIRDIRNTGIAKLEGFMVYLELPEDKESVIQEVRKHKSEKILPTRTLIQKKLGNIKSKEDTIKTEGTSKSERTEPTGKSSVQEDDSRTLKSAKTNKTSKSKKNRDPSAKSSKSKKSKKSKKKKKKKD